VPRRMADRLDRRVIIVRAMRVRRRDCLRLFILAAILLLSGATLRQDARANHDARGGHIDQISIDTGPPGPMRPLITNGKPAVGDAMGTPSPMPKATTRPTQAMRPASAATASTTIGEIPTAIRCLTGRWTALRTTAARCP